VSFTLCKEIAGPGGTTGEAVPVEHSLAVNPADRQQMFAFTERDDKNDKTTSTEAEPRFAIVGKVAQKADCRPLQSGLYMSMKRRCIEVSSRPDRTAKQLDEVVNTYKPVMDHKENKEYEKRKKAEGKRDRKEKADVQDMLFKCFELHQYWAFIDLVNKTQQPPAFLKTILKEIGHYNTKNPHKNTWELKEEYRHYSKDDQPGPSSAS
jgi:transcription initiation factor TFIIF subunit beta